MSAREVSFFESVPCEQILDIFGMRAKYHWHSELHFTCASSSSSGFVDNILVETVTVLHSVT